MDPDDRPDKQRRRLKPLQFQLRTLCIWTTVFAVMFALTRSQVIVDVLLGTAATFFVGFGFCLVGRVLSNAVAEYESQRKTL